MFIRVEFKGAALAAAMGGQTMGKSETEMGERTSPSKAGSGNGNEPPVRHVPCNDPTGRVRAITPEEQAEKAQAIAAFVEKMLAMPDEDPPGAWEEAMRDLDAHRPHRKLFEGLY
jgi:hypothetical protein